MFVSFIARNTSRVPYNDEYATFRFLFGPHGTQPAEYWVQHNEHRIPLPQFVYVCLVRGTGYDFRAPVVFNAAVLILTAAFLLWVVHRLRGRFSAADAFIPLTVLGLGGWENLIWGFQVQFVLSTAFALGFLGLAAIPDFSNSTRRLGGASVLLAMLPLCGANGVAFVPALAAALLVIGVLNLHSLDRSKRRPGAIAILGGLVGIALLVAYFTGLKKIGYHAPPPNPESVVIGVINFLGLSLGPVAHLLHEPGYDHVTILGIVVVGIVAATGVLLMGALCEYQRRRNAIAIAGVLGGLLCLAGGLAYGRAGVGNILAPSRYVTLAMPIPVTAYFAWVAFGRGFFGRVMPFALCGLVLAFLVQNTRFAYFAGGWHIARQKQLEYDIKAGMPLSFVAERNRGVFPGEPSDFRTCLMTLCDRGVKPFANITPDPALQLEDVPVRIARTQSLQSEGGLLVADSKLGSVVFALPRRHIYALEVTYEGSSFGTLDDFTAFVSWDPNGHTPPTRGAYLIRNRTKTGDLSVRLFVNCETDSLRIDLPPESHIRMKRISILSPLP